MTAPLSVDLGRLARPASSAPYEQVRLAMLDRLILAGAAGPVSHAAWEAAFAEAAGALREFGLELRRQDKATRHQRAADMLDLVGLSKQADRFAHRVVNGEIEATAREVAAVLGVELK